MLFIDIDHCKSIYDRFGHLAGDKVLNVVANMLQSSIRPMDLAARFGGEEFAIIMLGITIAEGREIAERLRHDIEHVVVTLDAGLVHVTVSIGAAELGPNESVQELLAGGGASMYAARENGRNCVAVSGQYSSGEVQAREDSGDRSRH